MSIMFLGELRRLEGSRRVEAKMDTFEASILAIGSDNLLLMVAVVVVVILRSRWIYPRELRLRLKLVAAEAATLL
jgi:hypothetical protein